VWAVWVAVCVWGSRESRVESAAWACACTSARARTPTPSPACPAQPQEPSPGFTQHPHALSVLAQMGGHFLATHVECVEQGGGEGEGEPPTMACVVRGGVCGQGGLGVGSGVVAPALHGG